MMERLLRNDNTAKLLSLILAVSLWFYVANEQNPTVTRTITEVPLAVKSLDLELAVVNLDPQYVDLVVAGPARLVNALDRGDFQAAIHLADVAAGPVVAAVRVDVPQGIQLAEVSPSHVIALVEPIEEVTLPIELAVRGRVDSDLRAGTPQLSRTTVLVRGAQSLVANVERVVTNIDLAGIRETLDQEVALYPVDASGRQVTGVQLIPDRVKVTVPIEPLPPLAVMPVEIVLSGEPDPEYMVIGEPAAEPQQIVVRGDAAALDGINALQTEPVDIEGAREPVEVKVPVILPPGVTAVGPEEVAVYVPIAPATEPLEQ